MVASNADLGGPAPGQPLPEQIPPEQTPPEQILPGEMPPGPPPPNQEPRGSNPYSNVVVVETRWMYIEKMVMRVLTFVAVMGFAGYFLCSGLTLANMVGNGIIDNQKELVRVLVSPATTAELPKDQELQPKDTDTVALSLPVSSSNSTLAKPEEKNARNSLLTLAEHQNWLSAGSLLTLVAFIFGVGLTLLLTLIRNVFRAQEEESQRQAGAISRDIATPLSGLIEDFIAFMRKKLSS